MSIAFGAVSERQEVSNLRRQLNDAVFGMLDTLPHPLRSEGRHTVSGYSGGDGNFFGLFYVPIWSFLHWAPIASRRKLDPAFLPLARTSHALSLFLHLWDDHLCDGDLPTDLLRLQVRTTAWRTFIDSAHALAGGETALSSLVTDCADTYLSAAHRPEPVRDLDTYLERFRRQIAIWTVTPQLLGYAVGGQDVGRPLAAVIENFALAWRLVDDIQDIHLDVISDSQSAVWLAGGATVRAFWQECRDRSRTRGELDSEAWAELARAIHASGCLLELLHVAIDKLELAITQASSGGWPDLARELSESAAGLRSGVTNADYLRA